MKIRKRGRGMREGILERGKGGGRKEGRKRRTEQ